MIVKLTLNQISWIKGKLSALSIGRYVERSNSDSAAQKADYIEAQKFESAFKQNLGAIDGEIDPSNEEEDLESSTNVDLSDDEISWIKNELSLAPALLTIKESESRSEGERDFYVQAKIFCANFKQEIDKTSAEEFHFRWNTAIEPCTKTGSFAASNNIAVPCAVSQSLKGGTGKPDANQ